MEEILIVLLGILGAMLIFAFVWIVLQIVANWRIFTKAGEAGWKSLIPFYADYITFKISWKNRWIFWLWLAGMVAASYSSFCVTAYGAAPMGTAGTVCSVLTFVATIISLLLSVKKSKAFGHGIPFALGLMFFTPIFSMILGFGSSDYLGPQD